MLSHELLVTSELLKTRRVVNRIVRLKEALEPEGRIVRDQKKEETNPGSNNSNLINESREIFQMKMGPFAANRFRPPPHP